MSRAKSRHRLSVVETEHNPFMKKSSGSVESNSSLKIENLTDARLIRPEELNDFIRQVDSIEENEDKLQFIESQKIPYLFSSKSLMKLVANIDSVKTKLLIIESIAGRVTDPKAHMADFVELFRYADEKERVEDAFRARASALNANLYAIGGARPLSGRGFGLASPGRGGRGQSTRKLSSHSLGSPLTSQTEEIDGFGEENVSESFSILVEEVALERLETETVVHTNKLLMVKSSPLRNPRRVPDSDDDSDS